MADKVKLTFRIHYHTQWGEQLFISGTIPQLGGGEKDHCIPLHWEGEGYWRLTIEIDLRQTFHYHYSIKKIGGEVIHEFGERPFIFTGSPKNILVQDTWLEFTNPHHPFFSSAFTNAVFKRQKPLKLQPGAKANVQLAIRAPRVPKHLHLCVSGNIKALGNWNPEKPLLLSDADFPNWTCTFYSQESIVEYKYGLFDKKKNVIVSWEESQNRKVHVSHNYGLTVQNDEVLRIYDQWKGAGVAIPVFSIRSNKGMGCGEFSDLKLLSDWAHSVGLKMIQILPINDTISTFTWRDSYPYNAISVNALHPIYLHINDLFYKPGAKIEKAIKDQTRVLNAMNHVDFEKVLATKLKFARIAFESEKTVFKNSPDYKKFSRRNQSWLLPYAMYCALRDRFETSDFRSWDKKYLTYDNEVLKKELRQDPKFSNEVDFFCFLQYHLDKQLAKAVNYTRSLGIIVKGDIPIGINRNGVEAWQEPHLFNFDQQAGAPPDDFAVKGQNWGFPTYNWQKMEAEDYKWWTLRFRKMADYFDAYRIDHILGFFRIWEIPLAYQEGLMGHFNPALPLSEKELKSYGVDFDFVRFCKPFITHKKVKHLFQDNADLVISTFFEPHNGRLAFKPDFDTEVKIIRFMDALGSGHPLKGFKKKICLLHYEVLFVAAKTPGTYHPRIAMHLTSSYEELPARQKEIMHHVYTTYFFHRHDEFWGVEGKKKLKKLVNATDMLVCGEDLGMIPNCVEGVMDDLMILSLEVQRMPKREGIKFGRPEQYPYLSVCTPATHDMSTLRGWWEEDYEVAQRFYNEVLQQRGKAPEKCEPWLNTLVVQNQLNAQSLFTVLSMQDWLSCDESTVNAVNPEEERINIPKNPQHYWKFRMHLEMEEVMKNEEFNQKIIGLLSDSSRV